LTNENNYSINVFMNGSNSYLPGQKNPKIKKIQWRST
jgi:hypothetical protein